ncbi:hypothetical protein ACIQBJ_16320 [Kitasatospora sp. NPDC088391]|uniref:hypothetical protein n=1 Tax=Kitasatospora sp. NPDC088391 TaxID=3364074 RepID=UPI003813ABE2
MEAIVGRTDSASGADGAPAGAGPCAWPWPWPWPELMGRRPVLVAPAAPGRDVLAAEGWVDRGSFPAGGGGGDGPAPGWSAVLTGRRLTVRRPAGELWFDGPVAADREWRRRVRDHGALLLITGPFTGPFDLRAAAEADSLRLLTVQARAATDL